MGTVTYSINYGVAESTVQTMGDVTDQLARLLPILRDTLATELVNWDDDAKITYGEAQKTWNASADGMPLELADARHVLSEIRDNYRRIEVRNSQRW